ncbi:LysR substrate-binding domain-containing protein [Psychromonas sp. KJ10-2]|uniref:LysR substrate-binding domain-containing protein n=1 Tax=Psychromonas sp. KJ10-2 TaxID=3391822 RepID=UPI0039B5EEB9
MLHWLIYKDSQAFKIKMSSNRAANDRDLVRRWCIDGVGVAKKSAIDIAEALLNGQLTRVMTDYHFPTTELWLVLPSKQMITPAVRLVRDQLKQKVGELRSQLINANQLSEEEWPLSSSPNQPI